MSAIFSYELTGKKESVANFISNISPTETPFSSMSKKASVANTIYQWLTDTDGAVVPAVGTIEGATAVINAVVEPVMLHSWTQIFTKAAKVSGTAESIGLYGRGKPMVYQMTKAGRQMKREIETALLSNQSGKVGTSSVAGLFDGVGSRRVGDGSPKTKTFVNAATTAGIATARFKEAELQDLLLKLWTAGANPSVIMFPAEYAGALSALRETGTSENMFSGDKSVTVNRQVEVYVDPLGQRLKLIPNRYMPADTIYVMDPSMFEQKILRNFQTKDLNVGGDYIAKQLVVELGLANKNPEALGIYNLTSTALTKAKGE